MTLAIDTETTGVNVWHGCRPFYVSTCTDKGEIVCWEWDVNPKTRTPKVSKRDVREIQQSIDSHVEEYDESIIFHNTKFDVRMLESIGIKFNHWDKFDDTLLASHVLASAESHGLKDLALNYLDIGADDQSDLQDAVNAARTRAKRYDWRIAKKCDPHFPTQKSAPNAGWWVMDMWLPRAVAIKEKYPEDHPWWTVCAKYGTTDAERTIALWLLFKDTLHEENVWKQYEIRRDLLYETYKMENHGMTVHKGRVHKAEKKYANLARINEAKCKRLVRNRIDNLGSSKQLQGILYTTLGLTPTKRTKTGWSTDADTLRSLEQTTDPGSKAGRFISSLMKYRKYTKALDYLWSYRKAGLKEPRNPSWVRVHPNYNVTGTRTTRLSSTDPNAQNISKQETFNLREVFGPIPGRVWFSLDYENIEFRIFAYESGDKNLIRSFEQGLSMHLVIGEVLHPKLFAKLGPDGFKKTDTYRYVKNGNFALIYGASERKANATYRVDGAYARIRKQLPKIDGFIQSKFVEGKRKGYITTLGGYRLQIPRDEPHKAANYFVQGSAGWAITLATLRVAKYLQSLPEGYHMHMSIHDELNFDFPKRKGNIAKVKRIKQIMELSGNDIGVPTPVDAEKIVKSWAKGCSLAG